MYDFNHARVEALDRIRRTRAVGLPGSMLAIRDFRTGREISRFFGREPKTITDDNQRWYGGIISCVYFDREVSAGHHEVYFSYPEGQLVRLEGEATDGNYAGRMLVTLQPIRALQSSHLLDYLKGLSIFLSRLDGTAPADDPLRIATPEFEKYIQLHGNEFVLNHTNWDIVD